MNSINLRLVKIICFAIFMYSFLHIYSQEVPKIIPSSPTEEAFNRYGEIPVSLATGVPNIEIPIYTITSRKLTIPISISYHASGIKVNDVSSEIGLGWVLNSGGVLTSTVMGLRDISTNYPLYPDYNNLNDNVYFSSEEIDNKYYEAYNGPYANASTMKNFAFYLSNQRDAALDHFSDRYYYSFPNGESGIFRRDFATGIYKSIPFSATKIIPHPYSSLYLDFEIITTDGTRYYFKDPGNLSDKYIPVSIISSDNQDTIRFYTRSTKIDYGTKSYYYREAFEHYVYDGCVFRIYPGCDPSWCGGLFNINQSDLNEMLIDSIVSSTIVVKFQYSSDRLDWHSFIKNRLRKITVISRFTREVIKEVEFNQSYFGTPGGNNARLKLDDIKIYNETQNEKYSFTYNSTILPDYSYYDGRGYHEDFWGYFNSYAEGESAVPYPFFTNGTNRYPNEEKAKACILEEIKYPTGGKTVFEYELNKVDPDFYDLVDDPNKPTDGSIGGLRVKRISSYSINNPIPQVKEYEYSKDKQDKLRSNMFVYHQDKYFYTKGEGCTTFGGGIESYYLKGYPKAFKPFIGNGKTFIYDSVTEYNGSKTLNVGKTVYYYKLPVAATYSLTYFTPQTNQNTKDNGIAQPILWKQKMYKFENSQYKCVQEMINTYSTFKTGEFQTGLNLSFDLEITFEFFYSSGNNLSPTEEFIYCENCEFGDYHDYLHANADEYIESVYYDDTKAYTQIELVTQTETREYSDDGNYVSKFVLYGYNDNLQIASKTLTNSKDDDVITYYKYPTEATTMTTILTGDQKTCLDILTQRNQISTIVMEQSYLNNLSNPINQQLTTFKDFGLEKILPEFIKTSSGSNSLENRIAFHSYDKYGNVTSVSKEGDIPITYYWAYNNTYPAIKALNITYNSLIGFINCCSGVNMSNITEPLKDTEQDTKLKQMYTNLNNQFPDAQFYIYTYKPLVGITSETDPNGITTYYEYDSFGRLSRVLNQDKKEIKKYTYHYKE